MNRVAIAVAGLVTLVCLGVPAESRAAGRKATVKVVNSSDWQIDHFFLSSSDEEEWGKDQLGEDVIGPGDSFELLSIPCETYDVMLVDKDGAECVVVAIDICGGNEKWVITNKILLVCQEARPQ